MCVLSALRGKPLVPLIEAAALYRCLSGSKGRRLRDRVRHREVEQNHARDER